MSKPSSSAVSNEVRHQDVVCPFCALLCDDLAVRARGDELDVVKNGCTRAQTGYSRPLIAATPTVDGKPVTLADAVQRAAQLLKHSQQPLISGLGTDVSGVRAALALAERCGAIVDHMHSSALQHNVRTLQTRGWITTTLAEVRNRADLVVLVGVDTTARFQNFLSRIVAPERALQAARRKTRRVVFIGPKQAAPAAPSNLPLEILPTPSDALHATVNALRAALRGRGLQRKGAARQRIETLTAALKTAEYPVLVWAPGQLDATNGDLMVDTICSLIDELNQDGRAAGLALGGDDGGQAALSTCTWLTGFPLRVSFAGNTLRYDPINFSTARLLATGAVDCLLWLDGLTERAAPDIAALPRIVLSSTQQALTAANSVFIPIGTPGVDHTGTLVRTDVVISMALPQLRSTRLPAAATVLQAIAQQLQG